jgi:hypothetical protein
VEKKERLNLDTERILIVKEKKKVFSFPI